MEGVCLDNYDLLEKFSHETLARDATGLAPEVKALQEEYLSLGLPRHPGKAVARQVLAEVQGAVLDGAWGIAYPKEQKWSKYMTIAYQLLKKVLLSTADASRMRRIGLFLDFQASATRRTEPLLDFH